VNHCILHVLLLAFGFSDLGVAQGWLAYPDRAVVWGFTILALILIPVYCFRNQRARMHKPEDRIASIGIQASETSSKEIADSEFIAAVGHEIRNPMNGIIGIVESIKTDGLDPDSKHKLNLLRQCADHLTSLLDDFLVHSKARTDVFKLDSEPFDVSALMESVVALSTTESRKRGIPVEIAISPAVPQKLIGDRRRIRQILLNYVYNALKHSSGGMVNVTVWRSQNSPGTAEIFFAVSDDGPGIPEKDQKDLFARFERNPGPRSDGPPGTRLGLFICKTLAEKMNGRVWLKSEGGKGSCFYFSALFPVPPHEENHASTISLAPLPQNLRHALLIDDAEYNRIALTGMLESLGLKVKAAADAREFLSLAKTQNFDVIFIDYSVHGLDGPLLAKQIRTMRGVSAKAAIFATTAFNTAEKRAACLAAGMDAFLAKPITLDRLHRSLKAITTSEKPVKSRPIPSDPLANLRLLAAKKNAPFQDELNLYFLEFAAELEKLSDALTKENSGRASYFAHVLYGRCSFINEADLELMLRKIEDNAATERWDEARKLAVDVQLQAETLRVRLVGANPAAQRA